MALNATRNGERIEVEPTGTVESHRGNHMAEVVTPEGNTEWVFVSEDTAEEVSEE